MKVVVITLLIHSQFIYKGHYKKRAHLTVHQEEKTHTFRYHNAMVNNSG